MFENLENIASAGSDAQQMEKLSDVELEYIGECISPPRPEELVERIDDLLGYEPPKAIDSIPEIATMIEPIRDQIPPTYLEAPNDVAQIEGISDVLAETTELRPEKWKQLSLEEKVDVLNELEVKIAAIEHRPPCPIYTKDMGAIEKRGDMLLGSMGVHVSGLLGESITINSRLLESDDPVFFKEALDTLIHEGRHSYQTYNMIDRETHTSQGDLTNWHRNLDEFGYQSPQQSGFKAYWMQPIEADARKFAEDVLTAYERKL